MPLSDISPVFYLLFRCIWHLFCHTSIFSPLHVVRYSYYISSFLLSYPHPYFNWSCQHSAPFPTNRCTEMSTSSQLASNSHGSCTSTLMYSSCRDKMVSRLLAYPHTAMPVHLPHVVGRNVIGCVAGHSLASSSAHRKAIKGFRRFRTNIDPAV